MALASERVILLAKAYAHQLEIGREPSQARAYIRTNFGRVSPYMVRAAVHQAQRGLEISAAMQRLRPDDPLRMALEGERMPASTVGVRIRVTRRFPGGQERINDLYMDMYWFETRRDLDAKVMGWLRSLGRHAGRIRGASYELVGPSRWPAH